MREDARRLWAKTRLVTWPEKYLVIDFEPHWFGDIAAWLGKSGEMFCAVLVEPDEVSLTVKEELWESSPLLSAARRIGGPFRMVTLDQDVDLDVSGFLAPAVQRLADAGIAIIPHGAFLKEHWAFHEADADRAIRILEDFIAEAGQRV